MQRRTLTQLISIAAAASLGVLACGGTGKTADVTACEGGTCSTTTHTVFPFSGPSCSGASFADACWQCVDDSCGVPECLTGSCTGYFTCFCACAASDTACQSACGGQLTAGCQSCAKSITTCQQKSCTAQCGTGTTMTACTPARMCANGQVLQTCSVSFGGLCQSQYYEVGGQTFTCTSCGDCGEASAAAGAACP